ncbi:1-aminocyclopropane-1-carboxylate deaminase/D-cysteine desulfhydrase [Pseudonocardia asaccharolytica]|uniref:D-cysteine desulfhydrase n=1 Tax=Pseudonocardia asaccharolytica DSM 44247 = NBRC 16224 TaxID=1123024 RepID=A0A511D5S2_9PSEU|nr:pyridoxal-phosphate dependent enzyme [Pseudonocardia asaccharolytica]GEL20140.1 D-cysteine desulfhydrase [Pseudonocardia asaccharolytica DSM 44247 = NBRC 16224]
MNRPAATARQPAGAPWTALPRVRLALLPTPLMRAERLEAALGCGLLLVKRDDLIGFGMAGNKARPLEFLLGAARARGAEVFVTGGGPGSNFCAAAAQAARSVGMGCELVIWGEPDSPNLALAVAAGARLRPTGGSQREAVDRQVAARLAELGPRGFGVPRGGSTPLGAVGFAAAAAELAAQLAAPPSVIVLPVGSGGSIAGLLAGLAAVDLEVPVLGVSVSRPPEEIAARVHALAAGCAALLGTTPPRPDACTFVDARGSGFGIASELERERARLALHTEGLLLDETYGAEALSVAVDRLADGAGAVVWWHTGGILPAVRTMMKGTA